jgi:transposase
LHSRANDLITEAHGADVDGIIFGNLDHIRENIANGSKFQQWAYATFVELVEYKMESAGLFVDTVNPGAPVSCVVTVGLATRTTVTTNSPRVRTVGMR